MPVIYGHIIIIIIIYYYLLLLLLLPLLLLGTFWSVCMFIYWLNHSFGVFIKTFAQLRYKHPFVPVEIMGLALLSITVVQILSN